MRFTYIIVRHVTEKEIFKLIKLDNEPAPGHLRPDEHIQAYQKAGVEIVSRGSDPDSCINAFATWIRSQVQNEIAGIITGDMEDGE